MYVIFPLDQLLDIDSGTQNTNSCNSPTSPRSPLAGQSLSVIEEVQSDPSPSSGHLKKPGQQAVPDPLNPSASPSALKKDKPQSQEKKSPKGAHFPLQTPSTLPSPPLVPSSPLQQQVSPSLGVGASTCLSGTPSSSQGVQRATSTRSPSTERGAQKQSSLRLPSNQNLEGKSTPPSSARASAPGVPSPARDTPSEITGSANIFLNKNVLPLPSHLSVSFSDNNTASPPSPPPPLVSEVSKRAELSKSDSFLRNIKPVSSLYTSPLPHYSPSALRQDKKSKHQTTNDSRPEHQQQRPIVPSISNSGLTPPPRPRHSSGGKPEHPRASSPQPESLVENIAVIGGRGTSEVLLPQTSAKSRASSSNSSSRNSSSTALSPRALKTPAFPLANSTTPQTPRQLSPFRTRKKGIMAGEPSFKELYPPALNETLKSYNAVTFKLIKTVADFSGQLSRLHEKHAEDLQLLVESYRKKHSDLRNERPQCSNQMFQAWETLLQEVEVDSQLHSDVAGTMVRQVSRPLVEKTFHRKIQSKKLFTHRESLETILGKTEEMLKKCRREHTEAYHSHCRTQSNASLAIYFDAHNAYVQQLHATNSMLHHYHTTTQPSILQELEDTHVDVNGIVIDSILQGSDILSSKALEQTKRYENLSVLCRGSDPRSDIVALVKHLDTPSLSHKNLPQHRFILPQPPPQAEEEGEEAVAPDLPSFPPLKNELVLDRLAALSSRTRFEALKKEATDLEKQISQLQEGMESLLRVQQRNLESSLYHKANELQEDISMKRFDLRVNQVHLSAVKAQKELFASKEGPSTDSRDRKMSSVSTGSMKSKWMKAFKSLKTTSGGGASGGGATAKDTDKKNGRDRGADSPPALFDSTHILQEYTYKKITACDVCHQILRGHSRQGLKCRLCKTNVHVECQERLPKCQPKSRLLRRQRSTSEIESKHIEAGEEESEPVFSINSLIASQPGRRRKDPPSPSAPSSYTSQFPLTPKGSSSLNLGRRYD